MTVTKTQNGRWRAIVKSGRRAVASRTFDLKRDAEAWHDLEKRKLSLGEWVDPKAGSLSLGHGLSAWLSVREGTVAGSTFSRDREVVKRLPKSTMNRPVNAVRSADLENLFAELLRESLTRGSVLRMRITLSAFYTWAVKQGMVAKNPVREASVPKGAAATSTHEVWPFNLEELRALHATLRATMADKAAADVAIVLGLTGLRWGELSALRIRDVQVVPRPAFRVSRSRPDGQAVRSVTKGGKPRTVPITDDVVAIVEPLLGGDPDAPLFPSADGTMRLLSNWRRATNWSTVARGRRVHDLRHTAATLWLTNGVDLKTVQTWLGHSSAKLTADTYAHWMGSDADSAALERLNSALGPAGGTPVRNLGMAK